MSVCAAGGQNVGSKIESGAGSHGEIGEKKSFLDFALAARGALYLCASASQANAGLVGLGAVNVGGLAVAVPVFGVCEVSAVSVAVVFKGHGHASLWKLENFSVISMAMLCASVMEASEMP